MNRNVFNSKRISLGIGVSALALSLVGGAALAGEKGGGHFARGIRAAMATLDLSDAQKDKVKAIFASHKAEGMAFRAQAQTNRDALKAAASAASPDAVLVGTAFLKVRADGQAAKAKMKAVRTEIDVVLTPEQRSKLDGWTSAHKQQRAMLRGGAPQS